MRLSVELLAEEKVFSGRRYLYEIGGRNEDCRLWLVEETRLDGAAEDSETASVFLSNYAQAHKWYVSETSLFPPDEE